MISVFRQPPSIFTSRTFMVSVVALGILISLEILAAGWKLFPELVSQCLQRRRDALLASKLVSPPQGSLPAPEVSPASGTLAPAVLEAKNTTLAAESFRQAIMMEASGQTAKAIAIFRNLQTTAGLSESMKSDIQRHLFALSSSSTSLSKQGVAPSWGARDEVGLQPGSSLGIIETKLLPSSMQGRELRSRTLRIAMKARPGSTIDVQHVKIHVYFYEKIGESEIVLTETPVRSSWLTPPLDWSNGNPQVLDVYYGGAAVPPLGQSPNTYYGYVVGIYYHNALQDACADPPHLIRDFPPPIFL